MVFRGVFEKSYGQLFVESLDPTCQVKKKIDPNAKP